MANFNSNRIKLQAATIARFVELREFFGETKSVAIPIQNLKKSGAACANCTQFKSHPPHHLMYRCTKLTADHEGSIKFVKPYNLCANHIARK